MLKSYPNQKPEIIIDLFFQDNNLIVFYLKLIGKYKIPDDKNLEINSKYCLFFFFFYK